MLLNRSWQTPYSWLQEKMQRCYDLLMFLFSTKHAKIIEGFDFIFHFSKISLAIFSSSERITTGYLVAGLSLQP